MKWMSLPYQVYQVMLEMLFQRWRVRRMLKGWELLRRIELAVGMRTVDDSVRDCPQSCPEGPTRTLSVQEFLENNLQQEIDALAGTGGTLVLPAGTRELRATLCIPSRVGLLGVPGQTTLSFRGVPYGLQLAGTVDAPVRGARVEHLILRHRERPATFTATCFLAHARDVVLKDLEMVEPEGAGFFLADDTCRVHLEDCRVYRAAIEGFLFLRSVSELRMMRCVAQGCGQSGMLLADWRLMPGMDPLDFNAQAHHAGSVVGFSAEDPGPVRIDVEQCTFRANRKMGICTDGAGLMRVVQCVIADNQCEGMTLDNGAWCCLVQNCHIYGNGRRAHQHPDELCEDFVDGSGLLEDGSSRVKLPGVSMDNAAFCTVSNNLIENNQGDGVKFVRSAYRCVVEHNLILSNNRGYSPDHPHYGVHLDYHPQQRPGQITFPSAYIVVAFNTIHGPHCAGINLSRGCVANEIRANHVEGAMERPIDNMSFAPNEIR
ncbi:MAG: right-handed parallel beta-helix repeat-containing protein [Kiritimatiellae bacterium]|nr:right-handed parallel beta-helix repeat-containing protein [Kiritimatiellia bacterium]